MGTEQLIRPGQLNLMTAGRGIAHAEENPAGSDGPFHGVQLWVAQPSDTRDGPSSFGHLVDLPEVDLGNCAATVLIGPFGGALSPARRDTDHAGVELDLRRGTTVLPLDPAYEHGLVVVSGVLTSAGTVLAPGAMAYLAPGADELAVTAGRTRPGAPAPRRALPRGGGHVVELRGPDAGRTRRRLPRLDDRFRPVRHRVVVVATDRRGAAFLAPGGMNAGQLRRVPASSGGSVGSGDSVGECRLGVEVGLELDDIAARVGHFALGLLAGGSQMLRSDPIYPDNVKRALQPSRHCGELLGFECDPEVAHTLTLPREQLVGPLLEGELQAPEPDIHPCSVHPSLRTAQHVDVKPASVIKIGHHDREVQDRIHNSTLPSLG